MQEGVFELFDQEGRLYRWQTEKNLVDVTEELSWLRVGPILPPLPNASEIWSDPSVKQAQAFVEDMQANGEIRPENGEGNDWEALEASHGDTADQYL